MTPQKKSVLMSAFLCPGLGQLYLGKRRGWAFLAASIIFVTIICYKTVFIVLRELPPETIMYMDPFEYAAAFHRIRHLAYVENMYTLIALIALWLGGIVDTYLIKSEISEKSKTENL